MPEDVPRRRMPGYSSASAKGLVPERLAALDRRSGPPSRGRRIPTQMRPAQSWRPRSRCSPERADQWRTGCHQPSARRLSRQRIHERARSRLRRQGLGDLLCDRDEELLKHLDTETSGAAFPQTLEQPACRRLLRASGGVEGVDENVGVDELARRLSAHAVRRATTLGDPRCRATRRRQRGPGVLAGGGIRTVLVCQPAQGLSHERRDGAVAVGGHALDSPEQCPGQAQGDVLLPSTRISVTRKQADYAGRRSSMFLQLGLNGARTQSATAPNQSGD